MSEHLQLVRSRHRVLLLWLGHCPQGPAVSVILKRRTPEMFDIFQPRRGVRRAYLASPLSATANLSADISCFRCGVWPQLVEYLTSDSKMIGCLAGRSESA